MGTSGVKAGTVGGGVRWSKPLHLHPTPILRSAVPNQAPGRSYLVHLLLLQVRALAGDIVGALRWGKGGRATSLAFLRCGPRCQNEAKGKGKGGGGGAQDTHFKAFLGQVHLWFHDLNFHSAPVTSRVKKSEFACKGQ